MSAENEIREIVPDTPGLRTGATARHCQSSTRPTQSSRSTTAGPMGWSCWEPSPEERRSQRPCPRPWRRTRPWAGATNHLRPPGLRRRGRGSIDTQFITFDVAGTRKPEGGWPVGTFGAQGTIKPIESGYYRFAFVGPTEHGASATWTSYTTSPTSSEHPAGAGSSCISTVTDRNACHFGDRREASRGPALTGGPGMATLDSSAVAHRWHARHLAVGQ